MTTISTLSTLPPIIQQYFNPLLLSTPCKFRDDSTDLIKFYQGIKRLITKKRYSGKWHPNLEIEKKLIEFEDLYESIKIKEENIKEKTNHRTKEPFYSFGYIDKKSEDLYSRFRERSSYGKYSKFGKHNEI
jgi:hypothetical protein